MVSHFCSVLVSYFVVGTCVSLVLVSYLVVYVFWSSTLVLVTGTCFVLVTLRGVSLLCVSDEMEGYGRLLLDVCVRLGLVLGLRLVIVRGHLVRLVVGFRLVFSLGGSV